MEYLELSPEENNEENHNENLQSYKNYSDIKRINAKELSYSDFFWNYMHKNTPIIINSTANDWLCRQEWVNNSQVEFNNLRFQIKNLTVPVANCSKKYFNSHEKFSMNFHEYLNYLENNSKENKFYLKDWHLKAAMPDYEFYKVPKYFASDWLNEYLIDNKKDDYRFVYMGPTGTWTPFHCDVFSSFSWSTNILGLKKWLFIVPNDELKLKDSFGNDPFIINEDILKFKKIQYHIVYQNENESIFIPSGWYHQVWNLTDTISINHNWFNGCNIYKIWKNLSDNNQKVIKEIYDCHEMDNFNEHCQIMLRATFGLNFIDFIEILEFIGKKRIKYLTDNIEIILFDAFKLNEYHAKFDLRTINQVVKLMKNDQEIKNDKNFFNRCDNLVNMTEIF